MWPPQCLPWSPAQLQAPLRSLHPADPGLRLHRELHLLPVRRPQGGVEDLPQVGQHPGLQSESGRLSEWLHHLLLSELGRERGAGGGPGPPPRQDAQEEVGGSNSRRNTRRRRRWRWWRRRRTIQIDVTAPALFCWSVQAEHHSAQHAAVRGGHQASSPQPAQCPAQHLAPVTHREAPSYRHTSHLN